MESPPIERIIQELAVELGVETSSEPGEATLNWIVSMIEKPVVINEDIARASPCRCYKLDKEEVCTSPGIIGILTEEMKEKYCPEKDFAPDEVSRRVEKLSKSAHECGLEVKEIPKEERYQRIVECLVRKS